MNPQEGITFQKQLNGYNRDEVDRYVENLAGAFQTANEEYKTVCAEYNELLYEYKKIETEREQQSKASSEIVAKLLIETELVAQKITGDAESEAEILKSTAQAEAKKILEDAYLEKASAQIEIKKLTGDAETEASETKNRARKLMSDAQINSVQINLHAKHNLEQANGSIRQIIASLQELLAVMPEETHVEQTLEMPIAF